MLLLRRRGLPAEGLTDLSYLEGERGERRQEGGERKEGRGRRGEEGGERKDEREAKEERVGRE